MISTHRILLPAIGLLAAFSTLLAAPPADPQAADTSPGMMELRRRGFMMGEETPPFDGQAKITRFDVAVWTAHALELLNRAKSAPAGLKDYRDRTEALHERLTALRKRLAALEGGTGALRERMTALRRERKRR